MPALRRGTPRLFIITNGNSYTTCVYRQRRVPMYACPCLQSYNTTGVTADTSSSLQRKEKSRLAIDFGLQFVLFLWLHQAHTQKGSNKQRSVACSSLLRVSWNTSQSQRVKKYNMRYFHTKTEAWKIRQIDKPWRRIISSYRCVFKLCLRRLQPRPSQLFWTQNIIFVSQPWQK